MVYIFTYIWLIFMFNVGIHTIHGMYGYIHLCEGNPKFKQTFILHGVFQCFGSTRLIWFSSVFSGGMRIAMLDTVDRQNPAPPRMMIIPLFIGF